MIYTVQKIAEITRGKIILAAEIAPTISYLAYDTRIISRPEDSLFFAIKSNKGDGHHYLYTAYQKGIKAFIIEDETALEHFSITERQELSVIKVSDTLKALHVLAAWHREQFPRLEVIGITGSNGKTVVKEWLYMLLKNDFNIIRSPKSFNSQIGVPLSIWQIGRAHTLGIFEAGISKPGEMQALEPIIKPKTGIFTNLGEAHQANFSSTLQKAEEKLLLFSHCTDVVYCKDYAEIEQAILNKKTDAAWADIKWHGWSHKDDTEGIHIEITQPTKGFCFLTAHFSETRQEHISVHFQDRASIENAIHCWIFMLLQGYSSHTIETRMRGLHAVEMRMEMKSGINGSTIINDSYNSDLQSLSIALDTLNQQNQHKTRTLILSDILESGKMDQELYCEVATLLDKKSLSKLIGIGPSISQWQGLFKMEAHFYMSTADFIRNYPIDSFQREAILLKGSRPFGFEAIARKLQQKTHTTTLETDLNALINNLGVYRSLLNKDTRIMAMVKAFSYGSGSYEIANMLQFHQTEYLAVAYADEGVYLRENGITLPIMVMNPEEDAFDAMITHKLEPEIYSYRVLGQFIQALEATMPDKPYPIHIKVDTGMHRLGFEQDGAKELLDHLIKNPTLKVQSVFTHLASTDVAEHDDFSHLQISRFTAFADELSKGLGYNFIRHAINSSGITRLPEAQFDMVRLGIGLYGIDPSEKVQAQLTEVNTLKTHISQIRKVATGESVGYSRKGRVSRDSIIATLGIGYADGFPRALGNGKGSVLVHNTEAPVIGNVCMDMIMIDITDIQEVAEGDEVIIFGPNYSVNKMAAALGTIAYEVLTSVSPRVKRVYYKD